MFNEELKKRIERIERMVLDILITLHAQELCKTLQKGFPEGEVDYIPPRPVDTVHAIQLKVGDFERQIYVEKPNDYVVVTRDGAKHRIMCPRYTAPECFSPRNELLKYLYQESDRKSA